MAGVKRTISASGAWLTRKASDMAAALGQRTGNFLSNQKIIDGYVVIAKKTQLVRSKPGVPAHLQSVQVKNSLRLSALVMDLPAFLCLPGRYIRPTGTFDPDKAYVQTLSAGRDSYLPSALTSEQILQIEPLTMAGPYAELAIGARTLTGNRVPYRFWGTAQPFEGVGCLYGYGAVYLSNSSPRWSLTWGKLTDTFVYRLVALAPNAVRYVTSEGVESRVPELPAAPDLAWTLEISESVLASVNAVAFTRFEGSDPTFGLPGGDAEANWETAQYPWFTFANPQSFVSDEGDAGFKVVVAAQVVYDYGGPYGQTVPDETNGWGETDFGSPAGGRGVWVAEVQVLKGVASILHQYKIYGGALSRTPLMIDHTGAPVAFANRWYADNVVYKTTPVTLPTGQAIMVSVTFVDRTPQPASGPLQPFDATLFLDVTWFQDGLQRTENVTTTTLTRSVFSDGGAVIGNYVGHLTAFDAGLSEGRFAIGGASDGTIVVMPVFSSFRPGTAPRLQILVADSSSVTISYDGSPGFAMALGLSLDEAVDVQCAARPTSGTGGAGGPGDNPPRFWTLPAGVDQVTYIGNHKFAFFISTEWTTPAPADIGFVPSANLAMAVFDASTGQVNVAGVIDPSLGKSGASPTGRLGAALSTLTQVYFGRRMGRIEVLRPESDGFIPASNGQVQVGHPATLLVTGGRGNAGLALTSEDGRDIKDGATAISYDSGVTWTYILTYGSPAGAFHCGNIAQARSEPVVRI